MGLEEFFVWNEKNGHAVLEKFAPPKKDTSFPRVEVPAEHAGKPVKEVFDAAFALKSGVQEVVLPESVEKIGSMAFQQCTALKSVQIGKSVQRIGYFCFRETPFLADESNWYNGLFLLNEWLVSVKEDVEELILPPKITKIADYAFMFNDKLQKIILPETVENLGMRAFGFGLNLKEVFIPKSVKTYHWQLFGANIQIEKLTIPAEIYEAQKIGESVKIGEIKLI